MKSQSKNTLKIGLSFVIGFLLHWFLTPLQGEEVDFYVNRSSYNNQLYTNDALIPNHSFSPSIEEREVFICKGPYSKRYHYKSDCGGLRRCSTEKHKITLLKAKEFGRTLCGYED